MQTLGHRHGAAALALGVWAVLSLTPASADTPATAAPSASPLEIIGTSPLPGGGIDRSKIPSTVQSLGSEDFERRNSANVLEALGQQVPAAGLSDVQGNGFAEDFRFRGFAASPLQGTAEGIAVYQNGMRLNDAFGDTVEWDLVPPEAIDRLDVRSSDPVFGLNALGGSVSMQMKNGFLWQGGESTLKSGPYGDAGITQEAGAHHGPFAWYGAFDALEDDGWRYHSPSNITRFYLDVGWKHGGAELHLNAGGAANFLGVIGPTPIQMLQSNWKAVFTSPQTTSDTMGFFGANLSDALAPHWMLSANVAERWFQQAHTDGNPGDFEACSRSSAAPGALCLQDDGFLRPPTPIPAAWRNQFILFAPNGTTLPFSASADYGSIDRTWTESQTLDASVQIHSDTRLFGRPNDFIAGASLDYSNVHFRANTELDVLNADLSASPSAAVPGTGLVVHNVPNGSLGAQFTVLFEPTNLGAHPAYTGLFTSDTLDLTSRLSATAGARLNVAQIGMADDSGLNPELNARYTYVRANPMTGLSLRVGERLSAFAGYSEANRIPTPLELDCADPNRPCLLENALVSDPPLAQVVSHTYELGLRDNATAAGRVHWSASLYRTDSENDIVTLASSLPGLGYFTNVPLTRRQGLDLSANYRSQHSAIYAGYSFTDATYQFSGTLSSPNNPLADANGNIQVVPGDRIPGMPAQQLKAGWNYSPVPAWTVGLDVAAASAQYFVGDDGNQNAMLGPYWNADLKLSHQLTPNLQLFAQARNLFNRQYATYGTYAQTGPVANVTLTDPRTVTPAQPLSLYAGIRALW